MSPTTLPLHVGQKSQLTRTITPINATNQNVTWSSDNAAIATVSNTGLVTAVANGTTTIRATTQQGSFVAQTSVTVTTPLPSYSTRLTGTANEKYGLAKSLSVMPGDTITMEVWAKYLDTNTNNWSAALTNLVGAIANGTAPTGTFIDGGAAGSIGGTTFPYTGVLPRTGDSGTGPKAYLNYIVFDKNYGYKTGGFKRLSATPKENGSDVAHEKLAFEGVDKVIIKEAGYVYIYLSNENDTPVEVYFDDFKVKHSKGPIVSSQDYYPFGLTYNSYQRENSVQQPYQYNGKEIQAELNLQWMDYGARMYDGQIGRWHVGDPLSERFVNWSPYAYAYNNPARYTDPTGMANIDEVERGEDPSGKGGGGGENEVEKAKRMLPYKTSITTCTSCPAGKEYDVYREASHNFDYDSESKIVYNNDGHASSSQDSDISEGESGPCPKGLDCGWIANAAKNGLEIGGHTGTAAEYARLEMIATRTSQGGLSNVGRSGNLKTIYWLGQGSKWLGRAGNAGAVFSVAIDANSVRQGTMSGYRFSYNSTGAVASIVVGSMYGGPYGAIVGGIFTGGQMAYDGLIWYGGEVATGASQFNNAWRSGWRPGMK